MDIVTDEFKRCVSRRDLSLGAFSDEMTLSPDFLQAHTTSGGFLLSPKMVPTPR